MKGLKKLQLSLIVLLFSGNVINNVYATPTDKRMRCHSGWYGDVEAFHARVSDSLLSNLFFGESIASESSPGVERIFTKDFYLNPVTDWGYRLALGYDFCGTACCNYGFSLEYTHFNSSTNTVLSGFLDDIASPTLFAAEVVQLSATYTNAVFRWDTKYNAVDFLGHQNLTFCKCVDVQLFAGARYINLREHLNRDYFDDENLIPEILDGGRAVVDLFSQFKNKFDGVGPRIGFSTFYPFTCYFGLATECSGELLLGSSRLNYNEDASRLIPNLGGLELTNFEFRTDYPRNTRIVPGLGGKAALVYRGGWSNCSSLTVEVGYRGDEYFGATDNRVFQAFNRIGFGKVRAYHDFHLSGPYASVSYHF